MNAFCAFCTADIAGELKREPLGKNGALVNVCDDCSSTPAREILGPKLQDISEGMSTMEMQRRMRKVTGADPSYGFNRQECNTALAPGYILVRVPRHDKKGKSLDNQEAWKLGIAGKPWASSARYLGLTAKWHLFERPDPKNARSSKVTRDPLGAIRAYQKG